MTLIGRAESNIGYLMVLSKKGKENLDLFSQYGVGVDEKFCYKGLESPKDNVTKNIKIIPSPRAKEMPFIKAYFETEKKDILEIEGRLPDIEELFNYHRNAKGDTHKTTEAKERISSYVFEYYQTNNKLVDESKLYDIFTNNKPELKDFYNPTYYKSAAQQLDAYKELKLTGSYDFELQGDNLSNIIYKKGKELSGFKDVNNWNPADLWLFKNDDWKTEFKGINNIVDMNDFITNKFKTKEIIPISLKQVKNKSKLTIVNANENRTTDLDFGLKKIMISTSLKSIFVETNCGYQLKGNSRGSANTLNLNFEGTFSNQNYAMGAVPSEIWNEYKQHTPVNVYSGSKTPILDVESLKKYKELFKKYSSYINNPIHEISVNDLDSIMKQRYLIIGSHLDFIMNEYDELMKNTFFDSQKITYKSSMYVKIAE